MNEHSDAGKTRVQRFLSRIVRFQYWIILCLCVIGAVFYYRQPLPEPEALKQQVRQAEALRDQRLKERDKLATRIEWLQHDKEFLEIAVGDKLNRKKEGETIIRFQK